MATHQRFEYTDKLVYASAQDIRTLVAAQWVPNRGGELSDFCEELRTAHKDDKVHAAFGFSALVDTSSVT